MPGIIESQLEFFMILELAKTGTWSGKKLTKSMLSDAAGTFADPVPVIVGHESAIWSDSAPAIGWIESVEMKGNTLQGNVKLNSEGQKLWDQKSYRTWSVGLSKSDEKDPWSLAHLALLGATNPAVKGLKVLEFSEGAPMRANFINFSESEDDTMDIEKVKADLTAEFAANETKLKAEFKAAQDAKDAEIAQYKADAETARKAQFSARVESTFKACEGKAPVEKLNDLKAMFSKDATTLQDVLEGINVLFSSMPPMVSGRVVGTHTDGKVVGYNDLKDLA